MDEDRKRRVYLSLRNHAMLANISISALLPYVVSALYVLPFRPGTATQSRPPPPPKKCLERMYLDLVCVFLGVVPYMFTWLLRKHESQKPGKGYDILC